MRQHLIALAALAGTTLTCTSAALCGEFGTNDEAKAMLARAIAEVQTDKNAAITKFNYNKEPFRDRDLFVFCFGRNDGKFTAHEAFVGKDVRTLQDVTHAAFGMQMYERASQQEGLVEVVYWSSLPGSTEVVRKHAYLAAVGDQACGVSAYQPGDLLARAP